VSLRLRTVRVFSTPYFPIVCANLYQHQRPSHGMSPDLSVTFRLLLSSSDEPTAQITMEFLYQSLPEYQVILIFTRPDKTSVDICSAHRLKSPSGASITSDPSNAACHYTRRHHNSNASCFL
jgi:hypothetical protein